MRKKKLWAPWGMLRMELCGSFPEGFLNRAAQEGYCLRRAREVDACTIRLSVYEEEAEALQSLAGRCGCSLTLLYPEGSSQKLRRIWRRRGLGLALSLAAGLLLLSSLFLWEIELCGNERVSDARLRRALARCGVEEGCFWPGLSADLVRSRMLLELPELGWMTVNISGSRAKVVVLEREESPEIYRQQEPRDLLASQGGLIRKLSVLNGKALVSRGQTVQKGDVLVSSQMESLQGETRLVAARAQVEADTVHKIAMACPAQWEAKGEIRGRQLRFSLQFGKKRINLYGNSGNKEANCDKIRKEYKMGIEGLFALPLRLVREEWLFYERAEAAMDRDAELCRQALERLRQEIDGEILSHRLESHEQGSLRILTLYVHCRENIASPSQR